MTSFSFVSRRILHLRLYLNVSGIEIVNLTDTFHLRNLHTEQQVNILFQHLHALCIYFNYLKLITIYSNRLILGKANMFYANEIQIL